MSSPENNPPSETEEFRENELSSEMNVSKVHGSILRERDDPKDGYEPIPLWLVTLFLGIVFWGGMYLAFYSGGFRSDVYNAARVNWTGGGAGAETAPDPIALGKRLFTQNCVVCHQSGGQGVAGQFPPLTDSEWVVSEGWVGDNHLVKTLLHGLQGVIQVSGATYNGAMPPWNHLKDDQIAYILTYIRSEWGNEAPPIPPEYVAQIREQTEGRREPWTQAELQAIGREMVSEAVAAPAPESDDAAPAPEGTETAEPAAQPEA